MTKFYENLNLEIIWKLKHTIHLMVPLHFCMKSKVTSLWHGREFTRRTIFSQQTDGRQVGRWYGQDGSNTTTSTSIGRVIYIYIRQYYAVSLYIYTGVRVFFCHVCESAHISMYMHRNYHKGLLIRGIRGATPTITRSKDDALLSVRVVLQW